MIGERVRRQPAHVPGLPVITPWIDTGPRTHYRLSCPADPGCPAFLPLPHSQIFLNADGARVDYEFQTRFYYPDLVSNGSNLEVRRSL